MRLVHPFVSRSALDGLRGRSGYVAGPGRIWDGVLRQIIPAGNVAVVGEEALVQSAACGAGEFDLEISEDQLRR